MDSTTVEYQMKYRKVYHASGDSLAEGWYIEMHTRLTTAGMESSWDINLYGPMPESMPDEFARQFVEQGKANLAAAVSSIRTKLDG